MMYKEIDPENIQFEQIQKYVDISNKKVIDIGCGDGRLSFQIANYASFVWGIDPNEDEINLAKKKKLETSGTNLSFHIAYAEELPLENESCDIAIFTLSLCCMANIESMNAAINEARRVLKDDGILINLQVSLHRNFNNLHAGIKYFITNDENELVYWETGKNSYLAIKKASMIDQKFQIIAEDDFISNWSYFSKEAAINDITSDYEAEYEKLDQITLNKIDFLINESIIDNRVISKERVLITILRKQLL